MNTYIYTGGSSLLTMKDNDIKNFDTISNHYLNIDWAWVIEEDGTFLNGNLNEISRYNRWKS